MGERDFPSKISLVGWDFRQPLVDMCTQYYMHSIYSKIRICLCIIIVNVLPQSCQPTWTATSQSHQINPIKPEHTPPINHIGSDTPIVANLVVILVILFLSSFLFANSYLKILRKKIRILSQDCYCQSCELNNNKNSCGRIYEYCHKIVFVNLVNWITIKILVKQSLNSSQEWQLTPSFFAGVSSEIIKKTRSPDS